ncbi:DUF6567 family protein [Tunicatimonas pelagia]|uniref:DUF6567 family protein n=1 Tax=Tunicatimonas pelagia TaxID=931531 RepID=UPI002665A03C|nr:DUF6567 family protein [Tunicatimonas pelagia]WKN43488.1 hypothetical protein P0M28_00710 [Tunicatimonas pelagia]
MKYFFRIKLALSVFLLLNACTAYHHGLLTEGTKMDSDSNIVDIVHGYAKVSRFWFLGGNSTDALVADARRNLLAKYPLEEGQYFTNYTLDMKDAFYFPGIYTTTAIITAEVVGAGDSDFLAELKKEANSEYIGFVLGQDIEFFDDTESRVVKAEIIVLKKGKAIVGYIDLRGKFRTKSIPLKKLRANQGAPSSNP